MRTLFFSLLAFLPLYDLYSFTSPGINGEADIHFSDLQGKKILIVNTASAGPYVSQYGRLEQLYETYRDSLVIVAFPSNDFGHEPGGEADIQNLVRGTYHVQFPVAAKTVVTGDSQSSLYQWLTHNAQNHIMNSTVGGDFQKYLIGSDGHLIGYFAGAVDPMDSSLTQLITGQ